MQINRPRGCRLSFTYHIDFDAMAAFGNLGWSIPVSSKIGNTFENMKKSDRTGIKCRVAPGSIESLRSEKERANLLRRASPPRYVGLRARQ